MKEVQDRVVQFSNRYKLTDTATGEVLGTFDFDEVTGTVQQVGTEIDKELFDSIANDLAARVKLSGGELADTIVTFSDISGTAANVASGDTSATLWGKVKNWFSRLKALAFKNKVAAGDFEAGAIKNSDVAADAAIAQSKVSGLMTDYVASISVSGSTVTYKNKSGVNMGSITTQDTTYELASQSSNGLMSSTDKTKLDGIESGAQKNTVLGVKGSSESAYRTGNVNITKANIGLGNVDNVKQYSASNPPPYPVVANGSYPNMTVGDAEKLNGKAASEYALSTDIPDVSNFAEKTGTYSEMSVGKAKNVTTTINGKAITSIFESDGVTVKNTTNATNIIPDENGAVNPLGRKADNKVGVNSIALGSNTIASHHSSIALGYNATASGDYSTALGRLSEALGSGSTALGRVSKALGSNSTALGGLSEASGIFSTALGDRAEASGSNSTALGCDSEALGENSTALGDYAVVPNTDSNTMQLGSTSLSSLRCKVNLTVTSDKRDKTDIKSIADALAFVERLTPVTFVSNDRVNYISEEDKQSENYRKYGMCDYDRVSHSLGTKKGERRRCGLLAQEVIAAMKEVYGTDNYANIVNDNFHDLQEKPSDVENKYTLAYANLVPFLIGAIKELNAKIKILEDKLQ